ncbi:hypothetical protein F5Y10DRAFT_291866 [Nemania abortiva]|nr:hypothetical protein F5Y10DRAFT_291866 [Nemania abortiva]
MDSRATERSSNRIIRGFVCLNALLFCSAAFLNLWVLRRLYICSPHTLVSWDGGHQKSALDNYPLERLATRSPVTFNADLFTTSVYKGDPRQELDEAWGKLVDVPMILVDHTTLQTYDATGKPTKGVDNHYYATVEVFHHLHCLDITRKFIWRDHYQHVDTFQDPPDMVWEHVDHCIDLLRQVLMCNSATGLLFYTDLGSEKQPEARVSTSHMCKNFSQISDWVWEHDSELGVYAEM